MSIQSEIDRIEQNVANTYDALEEQGATMPAQKNSNNLAATARTVSAGSGGTTVQADWSVNDPSNPRHVKERTHWKEVFDGPEGEVISETAVSFTSNIKSITGAMSNGIQVGGKYIVTWDGTDYVCVGKTCSDGNYIGNASFMNAGNISFADTGEPFLIQQFTGTYYALWKADKTAATITVKVVGVKETVWHKLDKGYLDEALQFGSETAVILPETTVEIDPDNGGELAATALLVEGQTYKVKYNGAEYDCTCTMVTFDDDGDGVPEDFYFLGNAGALLGTGDTGEPFIILSIPAFGEFAINSLDGSTSATVSITGEVVKPIDPKYLPEALQFGSELVEILPETTVEIDPENGTAEFSATVPLVEGQTYTVKYNGVDYGCTCLTFEDGVTYYCLGNIGAMMGSGDTGEPFIFMSIPSMVTCGIIALDGSTSATLSVTGEVVKKLDGKFLPDGLPYSESSVVELLPETTVEIDPDAGTYEGMADVPLTVGETYIVKYNGVDYSCVCSMLELEGMTACILGNLSAFMGEGDTGEPFVFMTLPAMGAFGLYPLDGSAFVMLSIRSKIKVVHKMAGEYLTEGVPYAEPFDDVIMAAWPSSIQSDGSFAEPTGKLIAGNVYKVNWGGTIYECAVQETPGFGMGLGNLSGLGGMVSPEPFGILLLAPSAQAEVEATGIILFADPPENYEFSIIGGWKVQKIDERCLPDSTEPLLVKLKGNSNDGYTSDTTYAEVENALCGDTPRMVYLVEVGRSSGHLGDGGSCYTFSNRNGGNFYFQCISGELMNSTPILKVSVIEWKHDNTISLYRTAQLTTT